MLSSVVPRDELPVEPTRNSSLPKHDSWQPLCNVLSACCSHAEYCDALWYPDSSFLTDGPWQVLHTWYADSRDGQGASACRMQSKGFLQTMKTASCSELRRSKRLVLGYQGTPYAELCDASRYQDIRRREPEKACCQKACSFAERAMVPADQAMVGEKLTFDQLEAKAVTHVTAFASSWSNVSFSPTIAWSAGTIALSAGLPTNCSDTISVLLLVHELVALVWPGIKAFACSIARVPCQCSVVISRMNRGRRRDQTWPDSVSAVWPCTNEGSRHLSMLAQRCCCFVDLASNYAGVRGWSWDTRVLPMLSFVMPPCLAISWQLKTNILCDGLTAADSQWVRFPSKLASLGLDFLCDLMWCPFGLYEQIRNKHQAFGSESSKASKKDMGNMAIGQNLKQPVKRENPGSKTCAR